MENQRVQASAYMPRINKVSGSPCHALTLVWDDTNLPEGGGQFIARIDGLDPRTLVSMALCLQFDNGLIPETWADPDQITVSAYPVLPAVGVSAYGPADPECDDLQVIPTARMDGTAILAYGFTVQPVVPSYDLVVRLKASIFEGSGFNKLIGNVVCFAGLHPAADVRDALALFSTIKLSPITDPIMRQAAGA